MLLLHLHLRSLAVYKQQLLSLPHPQLSNPTTYSYSFPYPCVVRAVENESQQYEINPDKAKQALQELDQQLQALSNKKLPPPKIKASDVKLTRDETTEEVPEVSGSALAYAATILFLFTIFYNILFYTVIKPSIDGPEPTPTPAAATSVQGESPDISVLQFLPSIPEVFRQRQ